MACTLARLRFETSSVVKERIRLCRSPVREKCLLREKTMLWGSKAVARLTLSRLRAGALARVLAVGSGLLVACHNPIFAVTFVTVLLSKHKHRRP